MVLDPDPTLHLNPSNPGPGSQIIMDPDQATLKVEIFPSIFAFFLRLINFTSSRF
jgi:hypothetical protein